MLKTEMHFGVVVTVEHEDDEAGQAANDALVTGIKDALGYSWQNTSTTPIFFQEDGVLERSGY